MREPKCFVSAKDRAKYWSDVPFVTDDPPPMWSGVERRSGIERRSLDHERRWDTVRGRRYRIGDRRKR